MDQSLSPSPALMARHHAAMKIVQTLDRAERAQLLFYVLVGSPAIDAAVEEVGERRKAQNRAAATRQRERKRELAGAR